MEIVNRGRTRGDVLATVKIDNGCSPMLALLADELPANPRRSDCDEVVGVHGGSAQLGR